MTRRDVLATMGIWRPPWDGRPTGSPPTKNVQWGLGIESLEFFKGSKFTDILDVMRDTGFIGLRLTQFPRILETYSITTEQMGGSSRRGLHG